MPNDFMERMAKLRVSRTPLEIKRLRDKDAEIAKLQQAIGLATTAVPSMEMDVNDPIGMMHQVVRRVEELERGSKWGLDESKRVHGLLDAAHQRIGRLEGAARAVIDAAERAGRVPSYIGTPCEQLREVLAAGEQAP